MPSVKVCLWNIQNYGSGTIARKWGVNSGLRNRFITDFVRDQQVDVLMIMEMSALGNQSLDALVSRLNTGLPAADQDWAASYCGSAFDSTAANPPTAAGQLTFRTDGRTEGYAVAWRTHQVARFSMVPGLNPIDVTTIWAVGSPAPPARTPLNLNTTGRPAGNVTEGAGAGAGGPAPKRRRTEYRSTGGYLTGGAYPYDETGALMNHWPRLSFPSTGKNNSTLRWDGARRPAYVVLNLAVPGGTARQRLCPVAAYHAPSNAGKAEWGALQAGLSRELYVTSDLDAMGAPNPAALLNPMRVVVGGDFNYSVDGALWPEWYRYFYAPYRTAGSGGADCNDAPLHTAPDAARRTTVQLLEGPNHDQVITGPLDNFFRHKIDLVFYRGAGTTAARVNVPDLLLNHGGPYAATLQAFHTHLAGVVAGLAPPDERLSPTNNGPEVFKWVQDRNRKWTQRWAPLLCGSWGGTFHSWTAFMTQIGLGQLTAPRQAAEFYHIFVSDHLPLVVTLNF